MPRLASEVEATSYMRLLCLGGPKDGKTCTVLKSAIGMTYVINSDDKFSLRPALEFTDEFEFDMALGDNLRDIEKCITAAREGVKEGRYQTILWDTITEYCRRAEDVFAKATENDAGEPDGRRYHPQLRKHIHGILDRLFGLDAHVIVNAHWDDMMGAAIGNQLDKTGQGICPGLPGQLRKTVPRSFQDVIFLDRKGQKREFLTSACGVFMSGTRNLPGTVPYPADISKLWDAMNKHNETLTTKKDQTK